MSVQARVILIPDRLSPPADLEQEVFGPAARVLTPVARHETEITDEVWAGADAVLAWHDLSYTAALIEKLRRCKIIVRIGVGYDNVDLEAAGRRGIVVCNVPDYGTSDVADHTIALLLTLARGICAFNEQIRTSDDAWHWQAAGPLRRLAGSTLGVIGLGRIGTAVALRAKAFGMRVVFFDPYVADGQDKALGVERYYELDELLREVDAVSFHAPLTAETRGMADMAFFDRLRPGALLVNTARGPIVDLDALAEALGSGRLRGAGLDVLPQEPPDATHPLIRAWRAREPWVAQRLVLTPHGAFYNEESYREMRVKAAREAKRVLDGLPPRNCVNRQWLHHSSPV